MMSPLLPKVRNLIDVAVLKTFYTVEYEEDKTKQEKKSSKIGERTGQEEL